MVDLNRTQWDLVQAASRVGRRGLDTSMEEFNSLIFSGGEVYSKNEKIRDNCYVHRLDYYGFVFKTATTEPVK
jgi:hypothetical protein